MAKRYPFLNPSDDFIAYHVSLCVIELAAFIRALNVNWEFQRELGDAYSKMMWARLGYIPTCEVFQLSDYRRVV